MPTPEPTLEPEGTEELTDDMTDDLLAVLIESFKGTSTVTIDRELKVYNVIPTDQGFTDSLNAIAEGDTSLFDEWDIICTGFEELSDSVYDMTQYSLCCFTVWMER